MKSNDKNGIFAIILTIFTIMSTVAQVIYLPGAYSISVLVATTICALGAGIFFWRSNLYKSTINKLSKVNKLTTPIINENSARYIENEVELRRVWELDKSVFGSMNLPFERFRSWWKRYKKGLFVLIRDNDIVASIGLWPMKATAFQGFTTGKRNEKEITSRSLHSHRSDFKCSTWYLSGIVITPKLRITDSIRQLLSQSVQHWIQRNNIEYPVQICAIAYSKEGGRLLRRYGFNRARQANEMADGYPLYILTIQKPDIINAWIQNLDDGIRRKAL